MQGHSVYMGGTQLDVGEYTSLVVSRRDWSLSSWERALGIKSSLKQARNYQPAK